MDQLQLREIEVFRALEKLTSIEFVLIGGYAVNAYALPRFSADCDVVVGSSIAGDQFGSRLTGLGYARRRPFDKKFARYEKDLGNSYRVSFDVLIGEVLDRQTRASITSKWIFENSRLMGLSGKTIRKKIRVRIIDLEALFVIKLISCRSTDMRDLFMLAPLIKDREWVRREATSRYSFEARFGKLKRTVTSKKFRDGLQGVYGLIDNRMFERSIKAIVSLNER